MKTDEANRLDLEARLTTAVDDAIRRSYAECFYCGSDDCWHDLGDDLVCGKTGGKMERDESKEMTRFVVRAVLEVVQRPSEVTERTDGSEGT